VFKTAIGEVSWNLDVPFNVLSPSATANSKWPLSVELKSVNAIYQEF
jgi:hypothetical protein